MTRAANAFCQGALGADHLANPHVGDGPGEALVVDGITISEQISRSGLVREGLNDLAGGPDCGGMIRDVEMEELAAVMAEADEDEEQAEGEGGDHEEVDGDDVSGMRGKKSPPRRGGPRRSSVHVLGDREFGDVVAEEGKFRPDASAAPGWIVPSHTVDQVANLGVKLRAAYPVRGGPPAPVELEALAVPGEDRRGLNDDEIEAPIRPQA